MRQPQRNGTHSQLCTSRFTQLLHRWMPCLTSIQQASWNDSIQYFHAWSSRSHSAVPLCFVTPKGIPRLVQSMLKFSGRTTHHWTKGSRNLQPCSPVLYLNISAAKVQDSIGCCCVQTDRCSTPKQIIHLDLPSRRFQGTVYLTNLFRQVIRIATCRPNIVSKHEVRHTSLLVQHDAPSFSLPLFNQITQSVISTSHKLKRCCRVTLIHPSSLRKWPTFCPLVQYIILSRPCYQSDPGSYQTASNVSLQHGLH